MTANQSTPQASSEGTFPRLVNHLKSAALVVTIVGAIPTAITAYNAWAFGVPFTQVPHRLAQYDLWVKNLDCKMDYKALATPEGTKVDVGACPTSGDIAIKISSLDGKASYEWIAYSQLQKPGERPPTSLIDLFVGTARAGNATGSFALAQAPLQVVCQALKGNNVVRIVNEGGKCFREVVSPIRGTVDKREEVPCTTTC